MRIQNPDGTDTLTYATLETGFAIPSSFVDAEFLAIASPFDSFNLGFVGGLSFCASTKADYKGTYTILSPEGVRFPSSSAEKYRLENDGRTIVITEGSFSYSELSATAGVNYVFTADGNNQNYTIAFVPSVLYSLPLTTANKDLNVFEWKFSQLQAGLDILFRL